MHDVEASAERLNQLGSRPSLFDPGRFVQEYPSFDPDGIGVAALERDAGYADPHATTEGLYRRAVELGAVGRIGCSGRAARALGTGAWSTTRRRDIDVMRPGVDRRRAVDGSRSRRRWGRPPADGRATRRCDVPVGGRRPDAGARRPDRGYYFRPEGEDLYLVGPVHPAPQADPDDFDQEIREDEVRRLAEAVVRRVPQLEGSQVHGGWASLYDVSPDWQPVIGEVAPNVFVDAGTSGHGFKLAPALGKHVADLVSRSPELDPRLAGLRPVPVRAGEPRCRPAIETHGSSADRIDTISAVGPYMPDERSA